MTVASSQIPEVSSAFVERSIIIGAGLSCVAYGVVLSIFIGCLPLFLRAFKAREVHRALLVCILCIFVLASVGVALQLGWDNIVLVGGMRYHDGSTGSFELLRTKNWVNVAICSTHVILNWLADGIVLYRYYTIYHDIHRLLHIFPILVVCASIGTGTAFLISLSTSNPTTTNTFTPLLQGLGLSFLLISATFNITFTGLVVYKLAKYRQVVRDVLGTGSKYTLIISILVESASLSSVAVVIGIVVVGVESPLVNVFLPVLRQVQAIYPLLVTLRVANARAQMRCNSPCLASTPNLTPQPSLHNRTPTAPSLPNRPPAPSRKRTSTPTPYVSIDIIHGPFLKDLSPTIVKEDWRDSWAVIDFASNQASPISPCEENALAPKFG